jgi:hypothetical protein
LPLGVGLVAGGLWVLFSKRRAHGGILPNPDKGNIHLVPHPLREGAWIVVERPPTRVYGVLIEEKMPGRRPSEFTGTPMRGRFKDLHRFSKRFASKDKALEHILQFGDPRVDYEDFVKMFAEGKQSAAQIYKRLTANTEPTCNCCG